MTCVAKGVSKPTVKPVREKNPPTVKELEHIIDVLEQQGDWQKIAYLLYTYDTGCRRAESVQLLKKVVKTKKQWCLKTIKDYDNVEVSIPVERYISNETRCKGKGVKGDVKRYTFDDRTMEAIKKWLDVRGKDSCPYVFVTKQDGKYKQMTIDNLNKWASNTFTKILGRRFHPNILIDARKQNEPATYRLL